MNLSISLFHICAFVLSYKKWRSISWALFHGLFGLGFLFYYAATE